MVKKKKEKIEEVVQFEKIENRKVNSVPEGFYYLLGIILSLVLIFATKELLSTINYLFVVIFAIVSVIQIVSFIMDKQYEKKNYSSMVISIMCLWIALFIYKYGGFFVSRYETGIDGASKKNQVVLTAGPQLAEDKIAEYQGGNMWYGLYNTAKTSSAINKKAVSTHMIYGSQYDQIINFIGDKAQIGHTDIQTEQQKKTGYEGDKDIMNNIYDLEGNNPEWTAEAYSNDRRVKRGGNFGYVEDL